MKQGSDRFRAVSGPLKNGENGENGDTVYKVNRCTVLHGKSRKVLGCLFSGGTRRGPVLEGQPCCLLAGLLGCGKGDIP